MRYFIYIFLTVSSANCENSFITKEEYANQLYHNPRGIGCNHCHGDGGKGKVIAKYIENEKSKNFEGPRINNLDYKTFYYALNERRRNMPRYFLTDDEITILFYYLQKEDR